MDRYCKRLIEVDLPIKRISAHSRREKSIRHGHISTLHIWWARRPLAACRAVICASLWPDPADDLCPDMFRKVARQQMTKWAKNHLNLLSEESWSRFVPISKDERKLDDLFEVRAALFDFIADFANFDNSTVPEYLETSRLLTQIAHESMGGEPGSRPLIVDPFAGGGSIPLEALRAGANAFASDLNPVAVLLSKVVLEYIPKFGQKLADEVRRWGHWVKEQAEKELAEFYPKDPDGATPVAYLWARTIKCEGPGCGAIIPMVTNLNLQKGDKPVSLVISANLGMNEIELTLEKGHSMSEITQGTVRRGSATCPICGYTTPRSSVEAQIKSRKGGTKDARLIAVVTNKSSNKGFCFRLPEPEDYLVYKKASAYLKNCTLVPDEELPYLRSIFNVHIYGMDKWEHLFNARQLTALLCFVQIIRKNLRNRLDQEFTDKYFEVAVIICISLALGRSADYWSSLCIWGGSFIAHTFGRQALGMIWDFAEANPFSTKTGNWLGACEWIAKVIDNLSILQSECIPGQSELVNATQHSLPDDSANAVITDPPYYDAVPFADLSDFFYIWHKRTLGDLLPELFSFNLSPKDDEIVQLAERNKEYAHKTREYFQLGMKHALEEARRILKPQGIGVVLFAHQSTASWEALLNGVIDAGWTVVASWPIDTERPGRLRAHNSAVLGSAVHLVCRPRENPDGSIINDKIGNWRDVLAELPPRIHEWMPRLAEEGVVGADAIFACLGPALEIYSRYSSVEKASGENVELKEYLEEVWAAVSREALNMIFEGADASGFEEDARLTAMWLWTLRTAVNGGNGVDENGAPTKSLPGYSLEYDAARKIAQGLGAHLETLSHLVEIKGNTAMLLPAAARTNYLFGKDAAEVPKGKRKNKMHQQTFFVFEEDIKQIEEESGDWVGVLSGKAGSTVLDQLHQSMILFAAGRGEATKRFLVEEGVGRNPLFWRLAQALSALYPSGTDEKRWVDGVLARKKGLGF